MTRSGIDKHAIAKIMREMQREFDKHPIRVPLETEGLIARDGTAMGNTVYNGPVIYGSADGAQLAWNNQTVDQTQNQTQQVAPGFEALAQAVVSTLHQLDLLGLAEEDEVAAQDAAREVLTEITRAAPDQGRIRRGLSMLKGVLAPVAIGLSTGAGEGAQEWAKTAIEQLGTPF